MLFLVLLTDLVIWLDLYLAVVISMLLVLVSCCLNIGFVGLVCLLKLCVTEMFDFRVDFGNL